MSDTRKRFRQGILNGYYYKELLDFAENFPTKIPPEEAKSAAAGDSHFVELTNALRVAHLEDNDVPLFTLLSAHGFSKVEAYLLISLMVRRKKERGRPEKNSILKLQARALHDTKKQLRAMGIRSHVHERAIMVLEEAHNVSCEAALSDWGLRLAPFDRDKLENHIRRSGVRRTNSRAK